MIQLCNIINMISTLYISYLDIIFSNVIIVCQWFKVFAPQCIPLYDRCYINSVLFSVFLFFFSYYFSYYSHHCFTFIFLVIWPCEYDRLDVLNTWSEAAGQGNIISLFDSVFFLWDTNLQTPTAGQHWNKMKHIINDSFPVIIMYLLHLFV